MDRKQHTLELQRNGGLNCAQAVITCFGKEYGIEPEAARIIGRPWGGGLGHLGGTCGYLTGAVHIIAHAFDHPDEVQARADAHRAVQALFRRFAAKRGTTQCKELLGADLSTATGAQKVKSEGLVKKICCSSDGIGGDVAELLETILKTRQ